MAMIDALIYLDEIIAKHKIVPQAPKWLNLPDKASTLVKHTFADGSEEIDIDELLNNLDDYTNDYELFEENGQKFVVYINTAFHRSMVPGEHNKWHVANCGTLEMMRQRNQLHKYARRSPSKDNEDRFTLVDQNERQFKRKILVCGNCVKKLAHIKRVYRDQQDYTFSKYLEEFSGINSSVLQIGSEKSFESGATKLANTYVDNWNDIAAAAKKRDDYHCAHCKQRYAKGFLESHHKDRDKRNNSDQNLQSLCMLCHCIEHRSDHPQMFHGYLKNGRFDQFVKTYPDRKRAFDHYLAQATHRLNG